MSFHQKQGPWRVGEWGDHEAVGKGIGLAIMPWTSVTDMEELCSYTWFIYNTSIRLIRYTANYQFSSSLASSASETLSSGSTLVFPCEPSIAKAPRHVILFPVSRPPTRLPT